MSGIGLFISWLFPTTHAEEEKPAPAEDGSPEEPKEAPAGRRKRPVSLFLRAHPALCAECEARHECSSMKHYFQKCQEKVQAGEELCVPSPSIRSRAHSSLTTQVSPPASPHLDGRAPHSLTPARSSMPPLDGGFLRTKRVRAGTRPASKVCARRSHWNLPAPTESSLSVARGTARTVPSSSPTCSATVQFRSPSEVFSVARVNEFNFRGGEFCVSSLSAGRGLFEVHRATWCNECVPALLRLPLATR
ncbi:hypothetical protein DFH09DRAFT_1104491 [Mycena vulgaris]|nr:hypothetical protein DFH09DRAFT_1104491 [Mycena vulgaris]